MDWWPEACNSRQFFVVFAHVQVCFMSCVVQTDKHIEVQVTIKPRSSWFDEFQCPRLQRVSWRRGSCQVLWRPSTMLSYDWRCSYSTCAVSIRSLNGFRNVFPTFLKKWFFELSGCNPLTSHAGGTSDHRTRNSYILIPKTFFPVSNL